MGEVNVNGARVLIADDEPTIRTSLVTVLEREGFECEGAATGTEAVEKFDETPFDVVIADIRMPGQSGVDVMRHVRARTPDALVILMTAHASLETAIEAVREGASDYLTKPVRFESLILKIRNLLRMRDLEWENRILRIERRTTPAMEEIIGACETLQEVKRWIARVAPAAGAVLIEGESGTGKELVARAVHEAGSRRGAFVAVNCSSIPDALLESEFFGYVKGAFTGAERDTDGLFQEARFGTLFLDEVGELPLELQPKVLRTIETKEVRPVGSSRSIPVDVRIVAATNKVLEDLVAEGTFREDLFFRLNVFRVRLAPLRERVEDIAELAAHFLGRFRSEIPSPAREISPEAMMVLAKYPWKGNVRELQNVIQRALITADHPVIDAPLLERLLGIRPERNRTLKHALRDFERQHVKLVLEESGGDKQLAAKRLGISLASLYSKLKA